MSRVDKTHDETSPVVSVIRWRAIS